MRNEDEEIDTHSGEMPPSRYDELDADFASILAEIGVEVSWNGNTYSAIVADPRVELDLQTGGFMPESDFQVKLRKASLPDPGPQPRQTVFFHGLTYAVKGVTDRPTSPLLVLHVSRK